MRKWCASDIHEMCCAKEMGGCDSKIVRTLFTGSYDHAKKLGGF